MSTSSTRRSRSRSPARATTSPSRARSKSPGRKRAPGRAASKPELTDASLSDSEESASTLFLRRRMATIRDALSEEIDMQMSKLLDDIAPALETAQEPSDIVQKKSTPQQGKVFRPRESKLTVMFQTEEFATIYNIFVAVLIILSLETLYEQIVQGVGVNFNLMTWCFSQIGTVFIVWLLMFLQTMLCFVMVRTWVLSWGRSSVIGYAVYAIFQLSFFIWPATVCLFYVLPPASALVVSCEQVRMMMKCHSYMREVLSSIPERPASKRNSHHVSAELPDFNMFIYFFFAPTLLFRKAYPRTPRINWDAVFMNFLQVVMALFYTYYLFERFCVPHFRSADGEMHVLRHGSIKKILERSFQSMLPGTVVLLLGFFAILHSWLNAWAELLRFADREFYKDWWNSKNFAMYYRTWNVVVHDWLFTYIYVDTQRSWGLSKHAAMLVVFTVSAIVHEYVIFLGVGFFFPVMLIMFGGIGVMFIYLTGKKTSQQWNTFMWVMLFFGNGLLMVLYSNEWFLRKAICAENESGYCNPFLEFMPFTFKVDWRWE